MSFTGNSGTGKTTMALKMAGLLHRLGYVRKGHLVSVIRDDLVGQYIGHAGARTWWSSWPAMPTAWTGSFRQTRLPLAHHIEVPDYADADLARISEAMLAAQGYGFDAGARTAMAEPAPGAAAFRQYPVDPQCAGPGAAAAGEPVFSAAAPVDAAALSTMTEADLRPSRVFPGGLDGGRG